MLFNNKYYRNKIIQAIICHSTGQQCNDELSGLASSGFKTLTNVICCHNQSIKSPK